MLASTATQIFYVEPLRREIEWRLAAFTMQQSGQLQMEAIYDGRIATLKAVGAPEAQISTSEAESKQMADKFKTADANIADYLMAKEPVENWFAKSLVAFFATARCLPALAEPWKWWRAAGWIRRRGGSSAAEAQEEPLHTFPEALVGDGALCRSCRSSSAAQAFAKIRNRCPLLKVQRIRILRHFYQACRMVRMLILSPVPPDSQDGFDQGTAA